MNRNGSEKRLCIANISLLRPKATFKGLLFGRHPVLPPSFVEIHAASGDKQTNQQTCFSCFGYLQSSCLHFTGALEERRAALTHTWMLYLSLLLELLLITMMLLNPISVDGTWIIHASGDTFHTIISTAELSFQQDLFFKKKNVSCFILA